MKSVINTRVMSVTVIAIATESGVPIFSRKRGGTGNENVSFYRNSKIKLFYTQYLF